MSGTIDRGKLSFFLLTTEDRTSMTPSCVRKTHLLAIEGSNFDKILQALDNHGIDTTCENTKEFIRVFDMRYDKETESYFGQIEEIIHGTPMRNVEYNDEQDT